MSSTAKRALGIGIAIVLILAIVGVVLVTRGTGGAGGGGTADPQNLTVVTGVIGSEKKPYFDDPAVKKIFAEHGYDVQVTTAGSRQIATSVDLSKVDFAFPSSAPAAEKIKQETKASTVFAPFYSPMAIATFTPIVELLQKAGVTSKDSAGTWHLDVAQYLALVAKGTRWTDLEGSEAYPNSRSILISSTDVRQSNSAGMYLSIASYVANGNKVVSSKDQEAGVIDEVGNLFLEQGFSASSSEAPFEDYLSQGIGSKPMVMVYEAQFLGREMSATGKNAITPDMVLMYPSPTVQSKHTVVPLTAAGTAVGQLLQNDAGLQKLAAQYGFRPADPSLFTEALTEHGLDVPANPVDVIDPPSYETLESMIETISGRYDTPVPTTDQDAGDGNG
jgi:hypothetical protein